MHPGPLIHPASFWPEIIAAIRNPDAPISGIMRLIAAQMALVALGMHVDMEHPANLFKRSVQKMEIFAARQVCHVLKLSARAAQQHDDRINFDSPKFHFLVERAGTILKESILQAGYDEFAIKNILTIFRDNIASREQEIRHAVDHFPSV